MGQSGPKKFKGKEDIIQFLVKVSDKLGIERDELATRLGISKSAFYGYITRREIPSRSYKRLVELYESESSREGSKAQPSGSVMLSDATLDELIHEIESRGWLIDLRRRASGE